MTNMYNNWFSLFSLIESFVKITFRHTPTSLFGQKHHHGKQRKLISNDELDLGYFDVRRTMHNLSEK